MSIKGLVLIAFTLASFQCYSQTTEDTIKQVVKLSNDYLNTLFNKGDAYTATKLWTRDCFENLKAGYNNGNIKYATNADLVNLFSTDLKKFLNPLKKPIKFHQTEHAVVFTGDEGYKYFVISFDFVKQPNIDSTLTSMGLDFISKDNGQSWKLNTDHWVGNYMYFLYRKNQIQK